MPADGLSLPAQAEASGPRRFRRKHTLDRSRPRLAAPARAAQVDPAPQPDHRAAPLPRPRPRPVADALLRGDARPGAAAVDRADAAGRLRGPPARPKHWADADPAGGPGHGRGAAGSAAV